MIDTLRSIQAGITAAALFLFMIAFVALLAFATAPVIGEAWRKWRKRGPMAVIVGFAAVYLAMHCGATKPHVVPNAGADDGIALVCIEAEYDSTNDVTAVNVKFTTGDVTTATPVLVRNAESEQWRELFKVDATVTPGQTNVLAFAVAGNAATNRFWWVGVDTPPVVIEDAGITITNFVATSKFVHIDWTCENPKATVFAIQRRRKKPAGIPYDAEVEYLENTEGNYAISGSGNPSNKGSYINTGILPKGNGVVEIGFYLPTNRPSQAYQSMFGGYDGNSRNFGVVFTGNTTYFLCGNQTSVSQSIVGGVRYDVVFNASEKSLTINGTSRTFSVSGFSGSSNARIYLFSNSAVGNTASYVTTYTLKGRIYYFRYYEGTTLVFDAIPVRKSGVGYLYDRVSGRLFGNAGTGAFAYGSDTLSYDWETVDTTSANTYTFEGFTIGEDWEWRITSTYTEGNQ